MSVSGGWYSLSSKYYFTNLGQVLNQTHVYVFETPKTHKGERVQTAHTKAQTRVQHVRLLTSDINGFCQRCVE